MKLIKTFLIAVFLTAVGFSQSLTGVSPSNSYKDWLHLSNSNTGVDATLRPIYDGIGNATALKISTLMAEVPIINATSAFQLNGVDINTSGTLSNVAYNNVWSEPQEGMIFDGTDDKITLKDYNGIQAVDIILSSVSLTTTEQLAYLGTNYTINVVNGVVTLGSAFTNATIYVDNVLTSTLTANSKYIHIDFDAVNMVGGYIGSDGTNYGAFRLYDFRLWNIQPDASLRSDLWNNGEPQKAKVPFKYRWGSQTEKVTNGTFTGSATGWTVGASWVYNSNAIDAQTGSGNLNQDIGLVINKYYRLTYTVSNYVSGYARAGGSVSFVEAQRTANGTYTTDFQYTSSIGTNGILYFTNDGTSSLTIDNVSVTQIGAVLDIEGKNMGSFGVVDASSNLLNGSTSGSPQVLHKGDEAQYVDTKLAMTGATTLTDIVPKGYQIQSIYFKNNTANAVTGGIKIGTTAGGTDVVAAGTVGANAEGLFTLASDFFSSSADQTLYVDAVTAWNSASIDIIIKMKKVN